MNDKGICTVSIAPVRASSKDNSEMVTQLLFGETFEIIDNNLKWLKLVCSHDKYVGWIDKKHSFLLNEVAESTLKLKGYSTELFNTIQVNGIPQVLVFGSPIYNSDNDFYSNIKCDTSEVLLKNKCNIQELKQFGKKFLNTPYLWGGRSSFGVDCSGLVQNLFRLYAIDLPRDASQQAECGTVLSFVEESKEGDLAFFDNAEGRITHVGLLLGDGTILHAHGHVRIDPMDSTGIFNTDSQQYSHMLRFIRRIIE